MSRRLRAVRPDEKPKKSITTVAEAAAADDRLAELQMMRTRIAKAIDDDSTPPRDLASLTRRQFEISKEIESMNRQAEEEAQHDGVSEDEEFDTEAI